MLHIKLNKIICCFWSCQFCHIKCIKLQNKVKFKFSYLHCFAYIFSLYLYMVTYNFYFNFRRVVLMHDSDFIPVHHFIKVKVAVLQHTSLKSSHFLTWDSAFLVGQWRSFHQRRAITFHKSDFVCLMILWGVNELTWGVVWWCEARGAQKNSEYKYRQHLILRTISHY